MAWPGQDMPPWEAKTCDKYNKPPPTFPSFEDSKISKVKMHEGAVNFAPVEGSYAFDPATGPYALQPAPALCASG